jgi:hypothetical protein
MYGGAGTQTGALAFGGYTGAVAQQLQKNGQEQYYKLKQ